MTKGLYNLEILEDIMPDYKEAFVFNRAISAFETVTTTLEQLVQMKESNDSRLSLIKDELYCQRERDDKYKLVFAYPKERKPYLRRQNADQFRKNGFASVCESNLHKACKCGLSEAKSIKIQIEENFYTIHKRISYTERICELMDCQFETDCEYEIEDISPELERILGGDIICFEIHHTSAVDAKKGLAYMLSGKPILEFHIEEKYIPSKVLDERCSYQESVEYFRTYYENTEKHYIKGTFFRPYDNLLDWDGSRAKILLDDGEELEVVIFHRDAGYRILFLIGDRKIYANDYFGRVMRTKETAKKFAEYRVTEHLAGRIILE